MTPRMDLTEFTNVGYLQEVNRRFFHPLGLALYVDFSVTPPQMGLFDARGDAEGYVIQDLSDHESRRKFENIEHFWLARAAKRVLRWGWIIQPAGSQAGAK